MYYGKKISENCCNYCNNRNNIILQHLRFSTLKGNLDIPCSQPTYIQDGMGNTIGYLCPYTNSLYTYPELYPQLIPYFEKKVVFTIGMGCELEELERGAGYYVVAPRYKSVSRYEFYDSTIKLRPEPGDPDNLYYNLEKLLKKIRHVPLSVRGDYDPLRTHIHIGFINPFYKNKVTYTYIVEYFDFLFGDLVKLAGRAGPGYIPRKDWREKEWGLEYRSFPSAILYRKSFLRFLLGSISRLINDIFYPVQVDMSWTKEVKVKIAEFMEEYLRDYDNKIPMTINKEWTNCDPLIRVMFVDEWDPKVKQWVYKQLLITVPLRTDVILFGIEKDKGMVVSGMGNIGEEIYPGVKVIEHYGSQNCGYCFGIPYELRVNGVKKYVKLWKKIFQLIKEKMFNLTK